MIKGQGRDGMGDKTDEGRGQKRGRRGCEGKGKKGGVREGVKQGRGEVHNEPVTSGSPIPPFTHTHSQSQKSQRGGWDLIRLSAVHHTQGERGRGRETTTVHCGGGRGLP